MTGRGWDRDGTGPRKFTLPKTNIAPKKWWFPIGISFSKGLFSGAMLVSGRVTNIAPNARWGEKVVKLVIQKCHECFN